MRTPILSCSIPQVLLLSVVFSSNALAQGLGRVLHPPEHSGAQARFDAEKIGEPSGWKILIDDNGALETFLILPNGDLVSGSLATSVTVPRDYCVLPGWSVSAPHVVLLAGVDSLGRGVVEVVQVDPLTMVPVSLGLGIFPGYDFLGVAFDPYQQRIALLDGVSQILVEAPWSPSLLLPMVTSFTAWDMSAMPSDLFLELSKKNLTFVDVGEGFPPSAGQYFIGFERDTYSRGHFLVPGAGATAYEGTWFTSPASYPPFSRSDNEGATVMLVQGRPGSAVEVVRHQTDAVIGQVAIPFAGWQFSASYSCPLSQPLEIGETYVVRYTGDITDGMSTRVLCVARYGLPGQSSPSGLTFGRVPAPRGAFIGNEDFDVTVPITVKGRANGTTSGSGKRDHFQPPFRPPTDWGPTAGSPWRVSGRQPDAFRGRHPDRVVAIWVEHLRSGKRDHTSSSTKGSPGEKGRGRGCPSGRGNPKVGFPRERGRAATSALSTSSGTRSARRLRVAVGLAVDVDHLGMMQ